jgi:alkylhydroperoxidase family enzyme
VDDLERLARNVEQELAALVLSIATVNVWNRLNVATRQVAGQEW